jgi:hypothetical protein
MHRRYRLTNATGYVGFQDVFVERLAGERLGLIGNRLDVGFSVGERRPNFSDLVYPVTVVDVDAEITLGNRVGLPR